MFQDETAAMLPSCQKALSTGFQPETPMPHHVLAIYDNPYEASLAVDRLVANGIADNAISVVASRGYRSRYLGIKGGTKGAEGAAAGVFFGVVFCVVLVCLVAFGSVFV